METTNYQNSEPSKSPADHEAGESAPAGHKRTPSGGILSKLSFLRTSVDEHQDQVAESRSLDSSHADSPVSKKPGRSLADAVQKTRRRRGSLRKAALLGRGAQRDKKDLKSPPLETDHSDYGADVPVSTSPETLSPPLPISAFGLGLIDLTPRPSMDGYASRTTNNDIVTSQIKTLPMGTEAEVIMPSITSPTLTYTSTTDEEDVLSIPTHSGPLAPPRGIPGGTSPGSDSFFSSTGGSLARRRSSQKAKSPLSVAGLAVSPLPPPDAEWDYAETEWWGWVVLIVTWVVFVIGMGSCLGVWTWAWDVGETPYAPPELEDDPTLPIVGYYPALIILTGIMAWVWVVVAWVGMKYFRHAKISGD